MILITIDISIFYPWHRSDICTLKEYKLSKVKYYQLIALASGPKYSQDTKIVNVCMYIQTILKATQKHGHEHYSRV